MLLGRAGEGEILDEVLGAARVGESRVLVIRGEAGIGKTALLEYVLERADGFQVTRVAGVQSEMELGYAVLHQLCAPMLGRLEDLPEPQRVALSTVFGLLSGSTPDPFLVGLAVLTLLSEAAGEQPLLCIVDDAQWLDRESARALAFAARRLQADSVALLFAVRAPTTVPELEGLPQLLVGGLDHSSAEALLGTVLPALRDKQVRDRIIVETGGNPLAILELPRGMTVVELASGLVLSGHGVANEIEESFARRVSLLPPDSRRLLLIAAAEPLAEPVSVWRAAERLGIAREAAEPPASAGLCEFGSSVRFRHPLVRSAVYRSAPPAERRKVHLALVQVTDPHVDPDRRLWHQAQGTPAPDEPLAAELERSAGRAQARGGFAQAAAFLQLATMITPDPLVRSRRGLDAARAEFTAGDFEAAQELLAAAQTGPLDQLGRSHADLLSAQIAFAEHRDGDPAAQLLAAARQLEPVDPALARETYLQAFTAAYFTARLSTGTGLKDVAEAARAAAPPRQPPGPADQLLDGLSSLFTEGFASAMSPLRSALEAFRTEPVSEGGGLPWLWLASSVAAALWDESWDVLSARYISICQEAGALSELPLALDSRVYVHIFLGEFAVAASLIEEEATVKEAIGSRLPPFGALGLLTWQGRETQARELINRCVADALSHGEGMEERIAWWASAVLDNSLGRYGDALVAARQAAEPPEVAVPANNWALVELVEAAARSGQPEAGREALERLTKTTQASGADWALGLEARSRALLSDGEPAEVSYLEAIERLGRTPFRPDLARAHLLYGEWLRRERRRVDARGQLRIAHEMLTEIGSDAFAERAARELRATGGTARKRTVETSRDLTPQEAQIARLASQGLSNPDIGNRLFISPRTVEYHLSKVFTKLGISSRERLTDALADLGS